MLTYEQRLASIETVDDLDKQLRLAKQTALRLRNKAKKAEFLADKIELQRQAKEAESVLRRLRSNYFDIESKLQPRPLTVAFNGAFSF